jgi:hypothetical protein
MDLKGKKKRCTILKSYLVIKVIPPAKQTCEDLKLIARHLLGFIKPDDIYTRLLSRTFEDEHFENFFTNI